MMQGSKISTAAEANGAAMKYDIHPAANMFPMMGALEFSELKADIESHGLREAIVLHEDRVLDGRNRLKACEELGIDPEFITLDAQDIGHDPLAYVVSANLHRRHLTESQRAAIGRDLEKLFAVEAKERKKRKSDSVPATLPEQKGEAREKAAAAVGVSPRLISSAKRVIDDGHPDVAQAVRDGRVTVTTAANLVRAIPSKGRQAAVVAKAQCTRPRDNDKILKRAINNARYQTTVASDEKAKAASVKTPDGVLLANEAINCLMRIPKNDDQRKRGFQIVTDWIAHNGGVGERETPEEGDDLTSAVQVLLEFGARMEVLEHDGILAPEHLAELRLTPEELDQVSEGADRAVEFAAMLRGEWQVDEERGPIT
jgi:hypothetical protein